MGYEGRLSEQMLLNIFIVLFFVIDGESNRRLKAPIKFLGISVGKFEEHADIKKTKKIKDYFGAGTSKFDSQQPRENIKQNNEMKNRNNKSDKEYIMKKFFQVTDRIKKHEVKIPKVSNSEEEIPKIEEQNADDKVLESDLNKQESFFARLLSRKIDSDTRSLDSDCSQLTVHQPLPKPTTPICEVLNCGDDSNDTYYSSSTINDEINKSVALFDEDPQEIDRVTDIRKLLNSTMRTEREPDENTNTDKDVEPNENIAPSVNIPTNSDIEINCPECGKSIPVDIVDTHADYHLALKLRDEERQQVRAKIREKKFTIQDKKGKPSEVSTSRNDSVSSIASFLVKLDNTIPTEICPECGKRVNIKKLTEHSDFHEAQKLSRELNHRPTQLVSTDVNKNDNVIGSSVKRKRKSTSPVKKTKMPKCKSIDSFFKIT